MYTSNNLSKLNRVGALFITIAAILSRQAHAYIDPGTGSYFVQMILATLASFTLFSFKPIVKRLKRLNENVFKKKSKLKDDK